MLDLRNMDCMELMRSMPDNSIDICITSPPYNKRAVGGGIVSSVNYNGNKDDMDEGDYQDWQITVMNELYRVCAVVFYNHKVRYQDGVAVHPMEWIAKTRWKLRQEIIWNRTIAANLRGWRLWGVDERIYWLVKSGKQEEISQSAAMMTSIWSVNPEARTFHPAPFPVEIPNRCISIYPTARTVLDPFCGSGSTAIAAIRRGMSFTGSELDKDYFKAMQERIKYETAQRDLFA